jgi:hypothetical protein
MYAIRKKSEASPTSTTLYDMAGCSNAYIKFIGKRHSYELKP